MREEKSQPICLCLEDFTGTTISASCDLLEIHQFRQTVKECTMVSHVMQFVCPVVARLQRFEQSAVASLEKVQRNRNPRESVNLEENAKSVKP